MLQSVVYYFFSEFELPVKILLFRRKLEVISSDMNTLFNPEQKLEDINLDHDVNQ